MPLNELRELITRHASHSTTSIADGVVISGEGRPGPPTFSMTGTVAVLMVQGAKRLALGELVHDYREGQCLVTSVDLPVTGHFTEATHDRPALGFALTLKPATIAELLLHPPAAQLPRASRGGTVASGIAITDASEEIVEAITRMVRLPDRPRDLPVLAPLVEREILWLLVRSELGAAVRQLGLADGPLSRVGHAVRWIRDHYADAIRVEDLAELANMSASTFHRTFATVTSMSPIQFQKQIRLQEARIRLMADPRDVAGAAFAVGYESASQFSREYRRRFGAPPAQDAARLRETAAPPAPRPERAPASAAGGTR